MTRGRTGPTRVVPLLASMALVSCVGSRFEPGPYVPLAEPEPDDVRGVLFLIGDAGEAAMQSSPLLHRLRADVERWSGALAEDSSVTVLFLGDNVYPEGVRDPEDPDHGADTTHLAAQVWTVSGPVALDRGTRGVFLAGNHDWGNRRGAEGLRRLRNQESWLRAAEKIGHPVSLIPAAGEPGPAVLDLPFARLVFLDTHWWLQSEDEGSKTRVIDGVRSALGGSGERPVVLAAHHPYASGGPHGGVLQTGFDPLWLLRRAGAMVQDLNSAPYNELRERLGEAFASAGAPLIFAAGHDHSVQVLEGTGPSDPAWTLVSGAGSKLSSVARADGLLWAADAPGYMRVLFRRGGAVDLFVEGLPSEFIHCEGAEPARARCMSDGVAAADSTFSARLRPAR